MRCLSTRGKTRVTLSNAIAHGLAPDGGLYVPEAIPTFSPGENGSLAAIAAELISPYFEGEGDSLDVEEMCDAAFTFEAPIRTLNPGDYTLELFHGPTAAFKDFGARFLAECLDQLTTKPTTILVATSGDTGAAVAAAFHRRQNFRVVILYPDGKVSPRQAHQLGAFGDNVQTYRVAGTFDDCQRLVKAAFADGELQKRVSLGSANSISLGRLLPQMAYYAKAADELGLINVVVPTGNLGNALACLMAKRMGVNIGRIVLATNSNRVLPDFLASGGYEPKPSIATLANAMDVGAPSNVERLRYWYPDPATMPLSADWVDDETIRQTIRMTWNQLALAVCPHTACGLEVLRRLRASGAEGKWVVAATAHPAKFDSVVEPLIGRKIEVPKPLAELLSRPAHATTLEASAEAFKAVL